MRVAGHRMAIQRVAVAEALAVAVAGVAGGVAAGEAVRAYACVSLSLQMRCSSCDLGFAASSETLSGLNIETSSNAAFIDFASGRILR